MSRYWHVQVIVSGQGTNKAVCGVEAGSFWITADVIEPMQQERCPECISKLVIARMTEPPKQDLPPANVIHKLMQLLYSEKPKRPSST